MAAVESQAGQVSVVPCYAEDVQLYLEACLEEAGDDLAFIAHALRVIARGKKRSQL